MFQKILIRALLLTGLSFLGISTFAQQVKEPRNSVSPEWSKPYAPFRIAGNLYYVGTYDLASYLITTTKGNILINTGLSASGPMIKKNIESLGFKLADTRILLTTQAHYDHMGAMAALKQTTGAKFMVDEYDVEVAEDGGNSDYALGGDGSTYAPVKVDRMLHDKDTISLGEMKLIMLHHPGHTRGSCSYLFTVKDKQRAYRVLIANMPTIVTAKKFGEIAAYPEITADYRYTLKAMKNLPFDIWLSSHASQFGLHTKHRPGDRYHPAAFMDRKGYDKAISDLQIAFAEKVRE
jgi:metallo-beta-lactamase class B